MTTLQHPAATVAGPANPRDLAELADLADTAVDRSAQRPPSPSLHQAQSPIPTRALAEACAPATAWHVPDPAVAHVWRFSPWKRAILPRFMPASRLVFVQQASQVPAGAVLLAWGRQALPAALEARIGHDLQRWQVEDGFLRSVGLGADLVKPLSWVIDSRGLYFDATRPSDLEALLQDGTLTRALRTQGAQLRQRIVDGALTKYNLAGAPWQRPPGDRTVVLVPGQVESDASLRFGSPELHTNLALLKAVRHARPRAWVVYKPHPDVVAGLRARGPEEAEAARWCDEVVTDARMDQLLAQVDEVHTLTSLSGFEALLRGLPVTCWGQPFYAGWGLTDDRCPPPRRSRRLHLDELVAGALIAYPRYAQRASGTPCSAAEAVQDLLAWRGADGARPTLLQRCLRPLLGWRKP